MTKFDIVFTMKRENKGRVGCISVGTAVIGSVVADLHHVIELPISDYVPRLSNLYRTKTLSTGLIHFSCRIELWTSLNGIEHKREIAPCRLAVQVVLGIPLKSLRPPVVPSH